MENILAALVIIFIILFAVLTLSQAFIESQDRLNTAWQEMESRQDTVLHTALQAVDSHTTEAGAIVEFTLRNTGSIKLADFDRWDVIIQYQAGEKQILWLPYRLAPLADNHWMVAGLYHQSAQTVPESIEPGVLNPGEEIVLQARLNPPIAAGSPAQILISTGSGSSVSTVFSGNIPPVLVNNLGVTIPEGGSADINRALLEVSDEDDAPDHLLYTITELPTQGSLSLPISFTQADINDDLLMYTHTGSGADQFVFTVSDGKDGIGGYTFLININQPPTVPINIGLNLVHGTTGLIGDGLLMADDPDNAPEDLVFAVITPPTKGSLSLPETFTQANINAGALFYTSTGSGSESDTFTFTVTDGETVIGPYTFGIAIH